MSVVRVSVVLTFFSCSAIWLLLEAEFLAITLVAALAGRLTPNRAAKEFGKGAADLTMAALLIGFARAIEVVLDAAMVKDTIISGIAGTLEGLPAAVAAVGMLMLGWLVKGSG